MQGQRVILNCDTHLIFPNHFGAMLAAVPIGMAAVIVHRLSTDHCNMIHCLNFHHQTAHMILFTGTNQVSGII